MKITPKGYRAYRRHAWNQERSGLAALVCFPGLGHPPASRSIAPIRQHFNTAIEGFARSMERATHALEKLRQIAEEYKKRGMNDESL